MALAGGVAGLARRLPREGAQGGDGALRAALRFGTPRQGEGAKGAGLSQSEQRIRLDTHTPLKDHLSYRNLPFLHLAPLLVSRG